MVAPEMEWNQNEKSGNKNSLTELTKILRLSDMISETNVDKQKHGET